MHASSVSVPLTVPETHCVHGMTPDAKGGPIRLVKLPLAISIVVAQRKRVSKTFGLFSWAKISDFFFSPFLRLFRPSQFGRNLNRPSALFEESLARHGVGSYHPGEMVRMDPALRNPLLKLLETRFGYVDGDFERDPASGLWTDGEGAELWETILPSGKPPVSGGRKRGDTK